MLSIIRSKSIKTIVMWYRQIYQSLLFEIHTSTCCMVCCGNRWKHYQLVPVSCRLFCCPSFSHHWL